MDSTRILVAGASSDIGLALLPKLIKRGAMIGAHCFEGGDRLAIALDEMQVKNQVKVFKHRLTTQDECHGLVDNYIAWAGGIDVLIQLTGSVSSQCHWEDLGENDWNADIAVNLSAPFYLAQRTFKYMKTQGRGRIVLMSTASASHGGGQDTLAYGVAKAGVECLVKGLAKGGAPFGILVNGLAPGFIDTRFHRERLGRDVTAMQHRAGLVPIKRAGTPDDVARTVEFLLSPGGDFITGEVITISGGDWL